MATIVTRSGKGAPLTNAEVDANFTNLNDEAATKAPLASPVFTGVASFPDGSAAAPSVTNTGDTNTGMFFPAEDTIAFSEGGVEVVRINSSGNVGIGTSSPTSNLAVRGTASDTWSGVVDGLGLSGNSTAGSVSTVTTFLDNSALRIGAGVTQKTGILIGGQTYSGSEGNSITFRAGNSERMRITSAGNVGIGTTSPAATLDVAGTGAMKVPVGTDAQRPTSATGLLRFNTDAASFEGYNGTEWGSIGGGATSDAIYENSATIAENITIATGRNGMSTGPITVNSGVTVTVSSGARYVVI